MQEYSVRLARAARGERGIDRIAVGALIEARLEARRAKAWAESDRIRDELAAMGVVLKDNKDGTTSWDVGRKGAS